MAFCLRPQPLPPRGCRAAAAVLLVALLAAAVGPSHAAKPQCGLIPGCLQCNDTTLQTCIKCKKEFVLNVDTGRCVCPQGSGSYYEPPLTGATVKAVQRSGYWAARKKPPFVAYPATKAVQNKFAVCSPCPIITYDGGSKQTAMSVGGPIERSRCAMPSRFEFWLRANGDRPCNDDTKWALIVLVSFTAQYYYRERGGLELFDLLDDPSPIACTNSGPPGTNGARGGAYLMPIGYSGLSEVAAQFISTIDATGVCGLVNLVSNPLTAGNPAKASKPCEVGYFLEGQFYSAGNILAGAAGGFAALSKPSLPGA